MTRMTKAEAEALTAFIMRVRPEWRPAGIMAALEKASPGADVFDVARAAINLASESSVLTPGLLPAPGPHWRKPDGTTPGRRGDHTQRCPEHPEHDAPHDHGGDMTPEDIAAKAAEIRATLPRPARLSVPTRVPPPGDAPRLDARRAQADQEKSR